MKRFFLFVQFLFLAIAANATAQTPDIIYIDGIRWELLGRPVCANSKLYRHLKAVLPTKRSTSTANWDGFTAYWSIKQDVLYLDNILCEYYDILTGEDILLPNIITVVKEDKVSRWSSIRNDYVDNLSVRLYLNFLLDNEKPIVNMKR